jgi:hypothetical protein
MRIQIVRQLARALNRFRVRHMISQKAAMLDFRLNLYQNFKTMGRCASSPITNPVG